MNVPKIRYDNFTKEWEKVKLSSQASFLQGLTYTPNDVSNDGTIVLRSSNIQNSMVDYNDIVRVNIIIPEKLKIKENDILMCVRNGSKSLVGKTAWLSKNEEKCTWGAFMNIIRPKEKNKFVYYYLNSKYFYNHVWKDLGTATVNQITKQTLESCYLNIPSIEEQEKISNTLSLLDQKIKLQSKKIEDLKLFKKGLIEFEFSNSNYNEINLKEILKERKTYSEKGLEFPHVTLSKDGIYDKTDRYNRDFLVKSDDKKYKITYLNDLCYNPANLKFGVICLNEYGSAIFSPIYVTFVIKNIANPKYIKYYVKRNNFINAIRKYEQGTVYERMAVAPEDFLKFSIKLPNIEIQNKFVAKLLKLDKKIELENLKLSKYIKFKKGLMQNMFV